jgi:hypothetical protein
MNLYFVRRGHSNPILVRGRDEQHAAEIAEEVCREGGVKGPLVLRVYRLVAPEEQATGHIYEPVQAPQTFRFAA